MWSSTRASSSPSICAARTDVFHDPFAPRKWSMVPAMSKTHYRTCHLCEAMCGVVIETEGDAVISVRGDDDDPFSRGHICPKAPALAELHADPDRLKTPLKRVAGTDDFVPVGWDEALDEISDRLVAIQQEHGNNSVATYLGNPTVHNHGSALLGPVF